MSIHLERAEIQLARGKSLALVKDSLNLHYLEIDYQKWKNEQYLQYENDFMTNKVDIDAEFDEDGNIIKEAYSKYEFVEETPIFEDWLNKTKVIEEAIYEQDSEGNEVLIKPETTELIRIYIPNDVTEEVDNFIKPYLLDKINKEYEDEVAKLTKGVPDTERSTWNKQEQEARLYLEDKNADVPFIKTLAENRGIPLDYLATKIIEKADSYSVALGELTGLRQKEEDSLK